MVGDATWEKHRALGDALLSAVLGREDAVLDGRVEGT